MFSLLSCLCPLAFRYICHVMFDCLYVYCARRFAEQDYDYPCQPLSSCHCRLPLPLLYRSSFLPLSLFLYLSFLPLSLFSLSPLPSFHVFFSISLSCLFVSPLFPFSVPMFFLFFFLLISVSLSRILPYFLFFYIFFSLFFHFQFLMRSFTNLFSLMSANNHQFYLNFPYSTFIT